MDGSLLKGEDHDRLSRAIELQKVRIGAVCLEPELQDVLPMSCPLTRVRLPVTEQHLYAARDINGPPSCQREHVQLHRCTAGNELGCGRVGYVGGHHREQGHGRPTNRRAAVRREAPQSAVPILSICQQAAKLREVIAYDADLLHSALRPTRAAGLVMIRCGYIRCSSNAAHCRCDAVSETCLREHVTCIPAQDRHNNQAATAEAAGDIEPL